MICVGERSVFGFNVGTRIGLVVRGVEIDFCVVFGPIIVRFSSTDRNKLGFSAGSAFFFFCVRAESSLILE